MQKEGGSFVIILLKPSFGKNILPAGHLRCRVSYRTGCASCSSFVGKAELKGKAKADVVVGVRRRVVVPVRHSAVPGIVVPAAATVHAVRALADTLLV